MRSRLGSPLLFLLAAIFITGGDGVTYLGCYKDPSVNARLLPNDKRNFKGTLTNPVCQQHCRSKGFRYAGTEWKLECFCSEDRPSYKARADESECNTKCDGDQNDICGGNLRLSVYDTDSVADNTVGSQLLGCYEDSAQDRLLAGARKDVSFQTPEYCVGLCYEKGFRIAGVQYGQECHCGDRLEQSRRANPSDCAMPCSGDPKVTCGGTWRLNAYITGIPDLPQSSNYVGCFKDNSTGVRLLSAIRMVFKERNTPKRCMNICYSQGYKFSGVEYGYECFCGNRMPAPNLEVEESQCQSSCPGDRAEKCGGTWRLSVYTTGIGIVEPYYPELPIDGRAKPVRPLTGTTRPSTATARPSTGTKPLTKPSNGSSKPATRPSTGSKPTTRPAPTTPKCVKSVTQTAGKLACAGQVIFREEFTKDLDFDNKWSNTIEMPGAPDYEFVVFNDKPKNMYIKNNRLYIKPTIQTEDFVTRGKLQLKNCTGQQFSEECERHAASYSILPPVETARIHTKDYFSFRYGTVHIRARLPVGDWIVPELWLEPKRISYGQGYNSGRIRLAMARGNRELKTGDADIGLKQLEAGVLMGVEEDVRGRTVVWEQPSGWHNTFHNFTFKWTPDNLSFRVDDLAEEHLVPPGARLSRLLGFEPADTASWDAASSIAPFDKEFHLSFGLSVGGMRDFPDDSVSGVYVKPWTNMEVKALLNFWKARDKWLTTWHDEESALQIDSVRIVAL